MVNASYGPRAAIRDLGVIETMHDSGFFTDEEREEGIQRVTIALWIRSLAIAAGQLLPDDG